MIRLCSLSVSIVSYAPSVGELVGTLRSLSEAVVEAKRAGWLSVSMLSLVDNGPTKSDSRLLVRLIDSPEVVSAFERRDVITGHGNIGFGAGHNLAIAESDAEIHLVLNPDVSLHVESIGKGMQFLDTNRDVVLVSPKAFWPDGHQQYLCKRYPSILDLLLRGFAPERVRNVFSERLSCYEMSDVCRDDVVMGIPIASGCFMLARRKALVDIGGFSKQFFMYFEDFDLSIRIREKGEIAYCPDVEIVHSGGHAARKGWRHIGMFLHSALTFFRRHGFKWF